MGGDTQERPLCVQQTTETQQKPGHAGFIDLIPSLLKTKISRLA